MPAAGWKRAIEAAKEARSIRLQTLRWLTPMLPLVDSYAKELRNGWARTKGWYTLLFSAPAPVDGPLFSGILASACCLLRKAVCPLLYKVGLSRY
jgi:hypothetical protein